MPEDTITTTTTRPPMGWWLGWLVTLLVSVALAGVIGFLLMGVVYAVVDANPGQLAILPVQAVLGTLIYGPFVLAICLAPVTLCYALMRKLAPGLRVTMPRRLAFGLGLGAAIDLVLAMLSSAQDLHPPSAGLQAAALLPFVQIVCTTVAVALVARAPLVRRRVTTLPLLMTWLSPAFPTGAYAYSHGLEWAVEAGDVTDEASAAGWLADVLCHGAGRSDAIVLRHAYRCGTPGALGAVQALAAAAQPGMERRAETLAQGTAFALAAQVWGAPLLATLPVGVLPGRGGGARRCARRGGGRCRYRPAACLYGQPRLCGSAPGAARADRRAAHPGRARPHHRRHRG